MVLTSKKIRIGIVGASGYTGEEIVRLALRHPRLQLEKLTSRQYEGTTLGDMLGLKGEAGALAFENLAPDALTKAVDVAFLCLPHGVAAEYAAPMLERGKIVIDLSPDFRLNDRDIYREYYKLDHPAPELLEQAVYGLPEINAEPLRKADLIACPGCYPTTALLSLGPMLRNKLVSPTGIVINSLSGVSGAGKKVSPNYLFCEISQNLQAYSPTGHRHIPEIEQELSKMAGEPATVTFVPHLVPVVRGMISTISVPFRGVSIGEVRDAFEAAYADHSFIRILSGDELPQTRRVIHSARAEIAFRLDRRTNRLILICAIDNLGKGAAWQAVQCLNIRQGFKQWEGLEG